MYRVVIHCEEIPVIAVKGIDAVRNVGMQGRRMVHVKIGKGEVAAVSNATGEAAPESEQPKARANSGPKKKTKK